MEHPPSIPPDALSGMESWEATIVWSLVPERTTWRLRAPNGTIRYLKVSPLGQELSLAAERDRMQWAVTQLPVPQVLDYGSDDVDEWLLTAGLVGVNAVDDQVRADPSRLVPLLATGLRQFHTLPVDGCPFDNRLDIVLHAMEQRVASSLHNVDREVNLDHSEMIPQATLAHLIQVRPQKEDLVVCHGDYCLPNVLINNGRVSGFVDLGSLGIADRWSDLAIAIWSITYNLGPGLEDFFLDSYGIQRAPDKLAFYRLLYGLGQ